MKYRDFSLHLVTDRTLSLGRDLLEIVQSAVRGGISIIQLREKDCTSREFVELGRAVLNVLMPTPVPLLVNDRVDVALAVGADGVHIGQNDIPYSDARRLLGPDAIIGLSVESEDHAREVENLDVDYLGLSPVFMTQTKKDLKAPLGLEGVRRIRQISRHRLVAIGGIDLGNISSVLKAGADGVAVVSAICASDDPLQATLRLKNACQIK